MNVINALKEAPELWAEFGNVVRQLSKARSPEVQSAIIQFREKAAAHLVHQGQDPNEVRTALDTVLKNHGIKKHGMTRGRQAGKAFDTIAVPDDFSNTKNTSHRPALEARNTGITIGTRRKMATVEQESESVPTVGGHNVSHMTVQAKGSPLPGGQSDAPFRPSNDAATRGTGEDFEVRHGRSSKLQETEVPDEREVFAVKIGDGPHTGKWMLARYNPERRTYLPVAPGRGRGKSLEVFANSQEAELRAANYARDPGVTTVPESEKAGLKIAMEAAPRSHNPVDVLLSKESKQIAMEKRGNTTAAERSPAFIEKAVEQHGRNITGEDAPRVQTREMVESRSKVSGLTAKRPLAVTSPFPDPRGTREGERLPRDTAPRARTHEVSTPRLADLSRDGGPAKGTVHLTETKAGPGIKSPFPQELNPDQKRYLIKMLPFLLGGGALAGLAGTSNDSDE